VKECLVKDFLEELKPWLDGDHIHDATLDKEGRLILHFTDGMKNVYSINDCDPAQMKDILNRLRRAGIKVIEE